MTPFTPEQSVQLVAWLLAIIGLVVGLYVLLLNVRHTANRHVGVILILSAISNFGIGSIAAAGSAQEAAWPSYVLAATSATIQPLLFLVALILLKPEWLRGWGRLISGLLYGLACLPTVLTVIDVALGTRLWYTGPASTYTGGYVALGEYAAGALAVPIRVVNIYACSFLALIRLLYLAFWDRRITPTTRRLARLFLAAQVFAIMISVGLRSIFQGAMSALVAFALYDVIYAYAAFQQMLSERRLQRGSLQTRLTALILVTMLPLLVTVTVLVNRSAVVLIQEGAEEQLHGAHTALAEVTAVWLEYNVKALCQLVEQPDVVSMDATQQRPVLQAMARTYPHLYLVSTTDLQGKNVARSDDAPLSDYSARQWFRSARNGASVAFEVLTGQTRDKPALVVSAPIKNASNEIVGVAMFAAELARAVPGPALARIGQSGVAYVVDAQNRIVFHPDAAVMAEVRDWSSYPPVAAMRQRQHEYAFTDQAGQKWVAHTEIMAHDWGVIAQQPESEILGGLRGYQVLSWIVLAVGTLLLLVLVYVSIRQTLQPMRSLNAAVAAIAEGDLTRVALVESEDEIGALARTVNGMTAQLRELVGNLERRVAERTRDLELRSRYTAAAADVGRAITSVLDTEQLIRLVVDLVRERFGLYYVGLFLVDSAGQWAILRAGTGEAGQALLERGHRLPVGESAMVGWCIAHAQARVAQEVGEEAVRLATPELPGTHSEAALPLRSRGRVLGALTVQSAQPDAFDAATIAALQAMTDHIAVALDNARLFAESQSFVEMARRASAQASAEGWKKLVHERTAVGYRSSERGLVESQDAWKPEIAQAQSAGQTVRTGGNGEGELVAVPIKVRDVVIGVLDANAPQGRGWTSEQIAMLETLADQLGAALESARLYRDTQRRVAREQLAREITDKLRRAGDMDSLMQTAVREMAAALETSDAFVQLLPPSPTPAGMGEQRGEAGQ